MVCDICSASRFPPILSSCALFWCPEQLTYVGGIVGLESDKSGNIVWKEKSLDGVGEGVLYIPMDCVDT